MITVSSFHLVSRYKVSFFFLSCKLRECVLEFVFRLFVQIITRRNKLVWFPIRSLYWGYKETGNSLSLLLRRASCFGTIQFEKREMHSYHFCFFSVFFHIFRVLLSEKVNPRSDTVTKYKVASISCTMSIAITFTCMIIL